MTKKVLSLFFIPKDESRRRLTVFKFIAFFASLFSFFCFFNFFTSVAIDGSSLLIIAFSVIVSFVCIMPVLFYGRLRKWLLILLTVGMFFYTVTFCIFCGVVLSYSGNVTLPDADDDVLVLVYGCRTYGDRPSRMLMGRLDAAYELLTDYPDSVCIVTGGQGNNEPITEALSMKRYLCGLGIADERIIMEDKAANTKENISLSMELIAEHSLDSRTVISVSDNYHLMRIKLLASRYGLDTLVYPADFRIDFIFLSSLTREFLSYIKLLVLG